MYTKDGKAVVSGITPKGKEWILLNCCHDEPIIPQRLSVTTRYLMELEGLNVGISAD